MRIKAAGQGHSLHPQKSKEFVLKLVMLQLERTLTDYSNSPRKIVASQPGVGRSKVPYLSGPREHPDFYQVSRRLRIS